MISAIVLSKNEEKNIKDCLEGLRWCDEIIVIDDFSNDRTVEIAKKFGARVIRHLLKKDFSQQRNFGLRQAQGKWIFFVDADERVTPGLAQEIKNWTKKPTSINGFFLKRNDYFLGRWLTHGEAGNIKILRLAKKDAGLWIRRVDEIWQVKGKTKTLKNPLLHYSHQSLIEFLISINDRSTMNAEVFYEDGEKLSLFDWLKPLAKFILNYFFRLGFLDGIQGFVFATLMSFHSFLVRGKLYLLLRKTGKNRIGRTKKFLFWFWTVFVLASYLYFLIQRGFLRWSN